MKHAEAERTAMLAGKYANAEELEKAYLELQSEDGTTVAEDEQGDVPRNTMSLR